MTSLALQSNQILVGLSWDPNEKATFSDKFFTLIGANKETFDLDLSCFIYGYNGAFLDYVSGMPGEMVDKSGCVRHSGDDREGIGPDDDEQISIDFAGAPEDIRQLFLVIEVASAHAFKDIYEPKARIVDVTGSSLLLETHLRDQEKSDSSACIFARLDRSDSDEWSLKPLNIFLDHERIEDWSEYLTQFLT